MALTDLAIVSATIELVYVGFDMACIQEMSEKLVCREGLGPGGLG